MPFRDQLVPFHKPVKRKKVHLSVFAWRIQVDLLMKKESVWMKNVM